MIEDGKFSPNFDLAQFEFSRTALERNIDNRAPDEARQNLYDLAWVMETVRAFLGGTAILITSGYRSSFLNSVVGGAKSSDHATGHACDFVSPTFGKPIDICRALEPVMDAIGIGQLINESVPGRDGRPREWVHLSIKPHGGINRVLTIDGKGTRAGILEARE
jgi:hypothetical protein